MKLKPREVKIKKGTQVTMITSGWEFTQKIRVPIEDDEYYLILEPTSVEKGSPIVRVVRYARDWGGLLGAKRYVSYGKLHVPFKSVTALEDEGKKILKMYKK
jgi:hypothetical protein